MLQGFGRADNRLRWHGILFAFLVLGYAMLLYHNISSAMMWNDEGLSYYIAKDGFHQTIDRVGRDVHAPLYYILLSFVLQIYHGEFGLRVISVVSAMITLVFVYLCARILLGRNVALLAAMLFAVSPDNLDWSQHARPYSFQAMLVAISFWGFVHILLANRDDDRLLGSGIASVLRRRAASVPQSDVWWLAYAIGGGLAMLAQHPAGFYVLACNIVMAVVMLRDRAKAGTLLVNWILANMVLVAIWLTWLPHFLVQFSQHLAGNSIATRHANYLVDNPWEPLVDSLGVAYLWRLQPIPLFVYLPIVAVGLWRAIRGKSNVLWVFLFWSAPLVICLAGYYLLHPIFGFVISTLHWMAVPYAIIVAFGIAAIRIRIVQAAVLLVLIALNARGISNYYQYLPMSRPDVIAQFLVEHADRSDGIIFAPSGSYRFSVSYYMGPEWSSMAGMDPAIDGDRLITTVAEAAHDPRNWVLIPEDEAPAVSFDAMNSYGVLAFEQRFGKVILRRFDRRD